ncbi:uncharacterized protein FMAN_14112 [Fusarium mangiferae]|uniref:Aminoglycoside phosphotransferase domain-containing protein n=1 Tax=Fusarium mangiferae TaxID=192010 RepID=A0A1L7UDW4_FUSMA|nr:uncharacterized protein FMAN_14112 [Fusarium mangiferae]CVL08878.1 uncharacterized protein FMAN_14112 [Fusarium mangiferae]
MAVQPPVNDSIREIDDMSWLLGEKLILSRSCSASPPFSWYDGSTFYYRITEATQKPQISRSRLTALSDSVRLVHSAGNESAVWEVGNAFVKVKLSGPPDTTREHVTLAWVKDRSPSFAIPEVLYHDEWEGRYYLVLSKVPGQTLAQIWSSMDEATKFRYVDRIVDVCQELAEYKANFIGGVDGRYLPDSLLIKRGGEKDFSNQNLAKNCKDLKMDCTEFVFFHCDLGPGNLVIASNGLLGIIDWETAGFVPKQWIRTRFCVSDGLNLPGTDDARFDWRKSVQKQLSTKGYEEIADAWMAWWQSE